MESIESDKKEYWKVCGFGMQRGQVVYFSQIILIYIVILTCIINLSLRNGDSNLWTALLSSCLGYVLPSPKFTKERIIKKNNKKLDEISLS